VKALGAQPYLRGVRLKRKEIPSFRQYPFCLPAIRNLDEMDFHPAVTFLIGENGTGKSTLLEAIAVAWGFNAEGGTRNFRFATQESHSPLHQHITLTRGVRRPRDGFFLRAESFYNVVSEIDRLGVTHAYGGRSLHEQSHGESFFTLFSERFGGDGLYILDEPEAALSPTRQLAMLVRMHDLVRQRSQFIIATHSPIIMAYPNAQILLLDENGTAPVRYEDTEHFVVTREFLNNRGRLFDELFGEPEAGDGAGR
jgi:predicted ATPase